MHRVCRKFLPCCDQDSLLHRIGRNQDRPDQKERRDNRHLLELRITNERTKYSNRVD